jgi:hypothetical protein
MIETIAFIKTGIGLTASIIYYAKVLENANILNNANKTRELQLKAHEETLCTYNPQCLSKSSWSLHICSFVLRSAQVVWN